MDYTAMYINIFESLWQVFTILLPCIIIGVIIMLAGAKIQNKKKSENKPSKQNYRHVQYLREIIGKDKEITSIIVFEDGATLKKIVNTNQQIKIINNRELNATLEKDISNRQIRLEPEQIDEIYNKLKSNQW